jgi:chromate transporter
MIYLQLFFEFFKTGLFAIGGGLATLPFLYEIADRTHWYTHADLANMIAISESTPGPIGINMATYVGYTTGGNFGGLGQALGGILGAVVATLAEVLPSILIAMVIARFLQSFSQNKIVKSVFYGLRPASVGMITAAGFSVLQISLLNIDLFKASGSLLDLFQWKGLVLAAVLYFVLAKWKPHPVMAIAASAVVGAVFGFAGV